MTRFRGILVLTALLALCTACATDYCGDRLFKCDYEIDFRGYDTDQPGAPCEDFSLTEKQVERFFATARPATWGEICRGTEWSPCYAYGIIQAEGRQLRWEIRPNGAGRLIVPEGESMWLLCTDCPGLFGDG